VHHWDKKNDSITKFMVRILNAPPNYGPTWPKHVAGILNSHLFHTTQCVLSWHFLLTCICLWSRLFRMTLKSSVPYHVTSHVGGRETINCGRGLWGGGRETMNFILHTRYVNT
jgi:hypothetical protein